MSNVKRFFSYSHDGFELHETAEAAKAEAEATLGLWTDGASIFGGYQDIYWGEVRGAVHEEILHHHGPECQGEEGCPEGHYGVSEYDYVGHCTLVDLPPTPDPEVERLRAELAAFRARVGAVLAALQDMEAHHRQAEKSLAHGEYSFERAEAYEHASDLLKEALTVGGEE